MSSVELIRRHRIVALLEIFIISFFSQKKARCGGLFASSVSRACTLSRLSSSQCETLVVCVYGFSLIRSVDSPAVHLLTIHQIDPSSSPLNTLVEMCSVEMAGVEPASPAPFGSLHTAITFPKLPGRVVLGIDSVGSHHWASGSR